MNVWQSGRETSLIKDIRDGKKTVEGRLNRDKFASYKVLDQVNLRADVYDEYGNLIKEVPNQALVEILKIEKYKSFLEMLEKVGYKKFLPRAKSLDNALKAYRKFYSLEEEIKCGVLAIYIKFIK